MLRPDLLPILVLFVYYQFWMFRMYEKYILWLDICGWTSVGCLWLDVCWMCWKFVVYEQYAV
ncbi:uncharacterized protein M6B38_199720 [Iris pallida]|uniref:ATP synthase F0 subunit 8 n=1 Tax=Iris pallida TaxID=29817 RepID=A0AAX6EAY1_IRIPA|nr:uncharacterized protein M6B38_199720 [Iris pallida]